MRKFLLLLASAGLALSALFVGLSSSAHAAVTPDSASPWQNATLQDGGFPGECNVFITPETVNKSISMQYSCSSSAWKYRDLSRQSGFSEGDVIELATPDFKYAMTWNSTYEWHLATPNDTTTVLKTFHYNASKGEFAIEDHTHTAGMYPKDYPEPNGAPAIANANLTEGFDNFTLFAV